MNFYIDKPTLRDIPAMRNLVLPEVQRGIILDRTEDEMAGAIRSYSVIRIAESSNSVLGMQFRTCENFQASTDLSLVESPKIFTNTKATPQSLRLRFCESQNLGKNQAKIAESTTFCNATIFCHSERSEESQKNIQNRDSSVASLPQNDNLSRFAESTLDSTETQNLGGNQTKFAESSLDSAISTQEANSAIADEFLGFCKASDKDKTKVYRGSEPKRALRKQLAHTCKSLKSRCESKFASPIVAFAALQILSLTLAEVRSLIVAENYRRNGLATMLIEHLIAEARALNLKEVLALTYQREVFEKLGFKEIAKESLPNQKIWADCIKCKKFPVCDEIALTKIL